MLELLKIILLFIVHGYFVYSKFKWQDLENIKILGNFDCHCNNTNNLNKLKNGKKMKEWERFYNNHIWLFHLLP
jgi:hypothetical protein